MFGPQGKVNGLYLKKTAKQLEKNAFGGQRVIAIALAKCIITNFQGQKILPALFHMRLLLGIITCWVTVACETNVSILSSYLHAEPSNYSQEYEVKLDTVLKFKIKNRGDTFLYTRPYFYKNSIYALGKSDRYTISKFSLTNLSKEKELEFTNNSNSPQPSSNFLIRNDSIFFLSSTLDKFIIAPSADGPLGILRLKNSIPLKGKFSSLNYIPYYSPVFSENDRIFFNVAPLNYFKRGEYKNEPLFVAADVKSGEVQLVNFHDGILSVKKELQYPYDQSFPYFLMAHDSLIINYPFDHNIYLYDLGLGRVVDVKKASSNEIMDLPLPFTVNQATDNQYVWNFHIANAFYEPLFYHEGVKLYSRAIHHYQPLFLKDGKLNDGRNRRTTLIILNEDFIKVGETMFNNGDFLWHGATPTPDGLLLYSREYEKDEYKIPNKKYSFHKI